jgi:hypothetical protein
MGLDLQVLSLGTFDGFVECAACAGSGVTAAGRCARCRGHGDVRDDFTIELVRALARLAPPGLDFLRFRDELGAWREVLRSGEIVEARRMQVLMPTDEDDGTMSIEEALDGATSAHWPVGGDGDDERWPDLPPLLLPRNEVPWDLRQAARDPVVSRLPRMNGLIRIGDQYRAPEVQRGRPRPRRQANLSGCHRAPSGRGTRGLSLPRCGPSPPPYGSRPLRRPEDRARERRGS